MLYTEVLCVVLFEIICIRILIFFIFGASNKMETKRRNMASHDFVLVTSTMDIMHQNQSW